MKKLIAVLPLLVVFCAQTAFAEGKAAAGGKVPQRVSVLLAETEIPSKRTVNSKTLFVGNSNDGKRKIYRKEIGNHFNYLDERDGKYYAVELTTEGVTEDSGVVEFPKSNQCFRVDTDTGGYNVRVSPRSNVTDGCRWIKYLQITRVPAGALAIDNPETLIVRAYKENIVQKVRYAYLLRPNGLTVRIKLLPAFDASDNPNCDATYCSWTYNISFAGLTRTNRIMYNGAAIFGRLPNPSYCDAELNCEAIPDEDYIFSGGTNDATVTIRVPVATLNGLTNPIDIEW